MGTFEEEPRPRNAVVLANWVAARAGRDDAAALARQRAAARRRARALHPSAGARVAEVIPFPRRAG